MRSRAETSEPNTRMGVGARAPRKEDHRHLHGSGQFVADIKLPGMRDAAFVRSTIPHGRLLGVEAPPGTLGREVWTAGELAPLVRPIVASVDKPGFRGAEYPILATNKVRFVGEAIAMCIAPDRAAAEDLAESVTADIETLPPVTDSSAAMEPSSARLHEQWPDNCFLQYTREFGDVDGAARAADLTITRTYDLARLAGVPLETRGCVAYYDSRVDQLVMYLSSQRPHLIRTFLAEQLVGIEERQLRLIAPDVGGGFGIKTNLYPEEVAVAAVALQVPYPVRWIEDRWENLVGSAQARDHRYRVTAHAARDGELLGLEADVVVDGGAYSLKPSTAVMEAGMASGVLPGPYGVRNYRFTATTMATNKTPIGPYRGVARPGACFAMERIIDEVAVSLGMEPKDVRVRNMVRPEEFPYESVTGMTYDSGDYPATVHKAAAAIRHEEIRLLQRSQAPEVVERVGVGYASYTEQTAHGADEWQRRGLPIVYGFESARAVLDPSGTLTLDVGIQSHGQGLETTLAQIANEVLGIPHHQVTVRHGDTGVSPYGFGTFASRSMVMAGGAVYGACKEVEQKVLTVAAEVLECAVEELCLEDGKVSGPQGGLSLAEVANVAWLNVGKISRLIEPGLEATFRYRPKIETGTFSNATHAVSVAVDTETGAVRLLDYVVVEDCGRMVNPMIVDGQVYGGVAQGIGQAMYEESRYDETGQPQCTTFLDYLLPGASEVPEIRIHHQETLSPFTPFGIKGMGEGGAIAPPAAIANAVSDALGVQIRRTPITPLAVWKTIASPSTSQDSA